MKEIKRTNTIRLLHVGLAALLKETKYWAQNVSDKNDILL
jgi:hypothetical protein